MSVYQAEEISFPVGTWQVLGLQLDLADVLSPIQSLVRHLTDRVTNLFVHLF